MNSIKKTVALIFGGRGHEHTVSERGAEYLYSLIDHEAFTVIPTLITRDGEWRVQNATHRGTCTDFGELIGLLTDKRSSSAVAPIYTGGTSAFITSDGELLPIDVAFPLLHGDGGEDGTVQGALECARIPYAGCNTLTSAVSLDKAYTKAIAESYGIPTAKGITITDVTYQHSPDTVISSAERDIDYPMFVKAAGLGSSVGVYRAENRRELILACRDIIALGSHRILIEEAIDVASELECAVLLTQKHRIFSDLSEIRCDGGFYTYERKYSDGGATVTAHAKVPQSIREQVREYTRILADALGTRHLSRFDFFLSSDKRIIFNEVNTLPGFTPTSMYAKLIENAGVPPRELVRELLDDAVGEI